MKKKSKNHRKTSAVRLIAGQWRGRKLPVVDVPGLRPTGDRIRETLFNWLNPHLSGSVCLDLFAGSGALGFEALSRGADKVILVENHPRAFEQLQAHCRKLSADGAELVCNNTLDWLIHPDQPQHSVDIVFIDPPFANNLWEVVFERLISSRLLAKDARIYIESPSSQVLVFPTEWQVYRQKRTGDICYHLISNL